MSVADTLVQSWWALKGWIAVEDKEKAKAMRFAMEAICRQLAEMGVDPAKR